MNKKQKIMLILITGIIIIILIILSTIKIFKKESRSSYSSNSINTKSTTNSNSTVEEVNYASHEGSGDSSSYKLNILGMTDEVKNNIQNIEELYTKIREYMFKRGLVEGNNLTLQQYQREGDKLKLRFTLDDSYESRVIAIIDSNNEYEFSFYQ